MKGVDRLVWPKQFTLVGDRRISVGKVTRAITADEELRAAAHAALRTKRLEAVLAKNRGPVEVTKELARSVMKLYDDDLYGATVALEAAGLEGVGANQLDIDDMAVAFLQVAVSGTTSR